MNENDKIKREIEREIEKEKDPRYLAEKERILSLIQDDSEFMHPCQNDKNTFTFVSFDKKHEIEIELSPDDKSAQLNIIEIDHKNDKSFIALLRSIKNILCENDIQNVYLFVIKSDWDERLSKIKDFEFIAIKRSTVFNEKFVITKVTIDNYINAILSALGFC